MRVTYKVDMVKLREMFKKPIPFSKRIIFFWDSLKRKCKSFWFRNEPKFLWYKLKNYFKRTGQRRVMWRHRWPIEGSRYIPDDGWDDLAILVRLVPQYPTPENRAILYQSIMNSPYVSVWFKFRYWLSNKVLFRLVWVPMSLSMSLFMRKK
jgi:hypothetical protein